MSVYAWGFGKLGQLGVGSGVDMRGVPGGMRVGGAGDRPSIVVTGGLFSAVLTQKGDVFVCGCGKYGRLGTGSEEDVHVPTRIFPAKDAKVSQIAAGSWHACAVTFLGRLYTWGYNSKHNVLGRDCDQRCSLSPGPVTSLSSITVRQVSCGHNFTLVATNQGHVYSWGCGRYGVLGHGHEECVLKPRRIDGLSEVSVVDAGYTHCGAVGAEGGLWVWGKGEEGALGVGDSLNRSLPTFLHHDLIIPHQIKTVSCSVGEHRGHTLALTTAGIVFAWGSNYKGKLGLGDQISRMFPTEIPQENFSGSKIVKISAGGVHSGAITEEGEVYTWGCGKDGRLGHKEMDNMPKTYHTTKPRRVSVFEGGKWREKGRIGIDISCSHYHTLLLVDYPALS